MKLRNAFIMTLVVLTLSCAAFARPVVDYDHTVNFNQPRTYSWSHVHTANSLWDKRVKDSIDRQLTARGWTQVPAGGDVQVVAIQKTSVHEEYDTYYNGFGGRRWGGMGESTTSLDSYKVGTLVVSMFERNSKQLIWNGTASGDVSGNPDKNAKTLDKDVQQMFKHFPPKAGS
jgi:hypothetical protein